MAIERLPWHRRLEARVITSVVLLVALSLAAILVATTRVVTARSLDRMAGDLNAAQMAFHRLVFERAEFASAQSALVTALPVFRAHLTDTRLAQDVATLEAMADHYRQQLKGTFAIVGDRDGRWIAASGWPADAKPSSDVREVVERATAGEPARRFVATNDRLFLVVAESAAFADEVLGTLTVGYALDDEFARDLSQVTGGEINFVAGERLYASSLDPAARDALAAALAQEEWGAKKGVGSVRRVGTREYAFAAFPLSLGSDSDTAARLILLEDWAGVQGFLNQLRWRLVATGAVIFAVALVMSVFFSRRLARPLEDLATAAQDIASGNWTRQLPVRGSAEETVMAQAVNAMTTNLRHWYEEAKARDDQLRQAQKVEALGRLAGGVAHDFNNFLTAIKGYGELLAESFEAGDRRRAKVDGILKAADTAAGLTRQLLAFSRKRVVAVQVLSVGRLLADTEKLLKRLIGEDIDLRTSIAPEVGSIKADPHQIEQVLLNLVVNARDAMPRGGTIDVELTDVDLPGGEAAALKLPAGRYVRLTVRDTGCGMTPEVKARIFEPFFTTKQEGAGTGLGLAVVFGIIEQVGGAVAVETELSRGTTFHIYFPHTAEAQSEPTAAKAPAASSTGTETILLVEDEPQVGGLVTRALRKNGYTVLRASRGAEALEIIRTTDARIDLLLTDIVMPGMNGRELADRVKALRPEIPVLYMSGYSDDAILRHGVEAATMHFIGKPFSIKALSSKVREILTPGSTPVAA